MSLPFGLLVAVIVVVAFWKVVWKGSEVPVWKQLFAFFWAFVIVFVLLNAYSRSKQ